MTVARQVMAVVITFSKFNKIHYSVRLVLVGLLGRETPYITFKNNATLV
jgi:hypothetical protein